jgi:uncharacterized membrane protein
MKQVWREVLVLVGLILLIDAIFIAAYFVGDVRTVSDPAKLAFTVVWTLVTLAVVIRGLSRVRKARLIGPRPSRNIPH